jgi:hypothetical protein
LSVDPAYHARRSHLVTFISALDWAFTSGTGTLLSH